MSEPPARLDGAEVLLWVVSQRGGYFQQSGSDAPVTIEAMAIARYANGGSLYLFECGPDWHVVADYDCESVADAQDIAAQHSFGEVLEWRTRAEPGPPADGGRDSSS